MKVIIDPSLCIGSGQCVLIAPAVFDQRDDDGIVVLKQENPPEALRAAVRQAVTVCPSAAIWLEEDEA